MSSASTMNSRPAVTRHRRRERVLRRLAAGLMPLITTSMLLPAGAGAAPSPSLIAQEPMFLEMTVPSNVFFVLDDSQSMMQMRLPVPPGITLPGGTNVTVKMHPSGANVSVNASTEWTLRSATLNPLFYNPAITYRPWNNNGTRMAESDISTTTRSDGFRIGNTRHDPRFAGPNFTSSTTTTLAAISPNERGANALVENSEGGNENWFSGTTSNGDRQDIFIQQLQFANNSTSTTCNARNTSAMVTQSSSTCSVTPTNRATQWRGEDACTGNYGAFVTTNTAPVTYTCPAPTESGSRTSLSPQSRQICLAGANFGSNQCCTGTITTANTQVLCSGNSCPCIDQTTTNNISNCPAGQTCPVGDYFYRVPSSQVIARYYRFERPSTATTAALLASAKADPANYKRVWIDRDQTSWTYPVYDADGNVARRAPVNPSDPVLPNHCVSLPPKDGSVCSFQEEAQNFANWYTYYRTRLFSAVAVTAESLTGLSAANGNLDKLRIGYGSINYFPSGANPHSYNNPWNQPVQPGQHGAATSAVDPNVGDAGYVDNQGTLVRGVRAFTAGSTERQAVFNWLFSLRTIGATPNREAIDSVGRYLSRKDSMGPWGDNPGSTVGRAPEQHLSCRRNYLILLTDGEWTNQSSVDAARPIQPRIQDRPVLPSWIDDQGGTPLSAASTDGPQHSGAGQAQGRTYQYKPSIETSFSQVSNSATNTLTDAALFWWSRDLRPDLINNVAPIDTPAARRNESFWQNLTPYIVGYGIAASEDTEVRRQDIADRDPITWPSINTSAGIITDRDAACSFSGTNPSGCGRINDTFRAARGARGDFLAATDVEGLARQVAGAIRAIAEQQGSGTAAAARSATLAADDLVITANYTTSRWTGTLAAYKAIDWLTAIEKATALPTPQWSANFPSSRNMLTSTGSVSSGAAFTWDSLTTEQKAALGDNSNVLAWLRGDQSKEVTAPGGTLRARATLLADIVNSSPVYTKALDYGFNSLADSKNVTYLTYLNNKRTGRTSAVMVGANGGAWHIFGASDGKELAAYVPRGVYANLSLLAGTGYQHRYYVDGQTTEGDYIDGTWKTVAVGTLGAGGRGVFAINTTSPDGIDASDVLWDYTGADIADMGHILAPGVVGRTRDGKWYYFVGNGYESTNDKARLLAIELSTGAVTSIPVASGNDYGGSNPTATLVANRPNGMGGITPVYDSARNVVAIYGGDRLGHLWKFNLSNLGATQTLSQITGSLLFTAADADGKRQPITAAPRVSPHPLGGFYVTFGTGRFFEIGDPSDQSKQSIYAVWEPGGVGGTAGGWTRSDLAGFSFTETTETSSGRTFRSLTGLNTLNWSTHKGWRVDLVVGTGSGTGERVITTPVDSLGYVSLTSFEPSANGDPCVGGGKSFFYRFDIATSFSRPSFDGRPTTTVGVDIPPTVAPQRIFARAPTTSTSSQSTLTSTQLNALLGRGTAVSQVGCGRATGSSIQGAPFAAPRGPCAVPGVRVWRELPRTTGN